MIDRLRRLRRLLRSAQGRTMTPMAKPFTCPICGARSFHPEDIRQGYCGRCHAFTASCSSGCDKRPTTVLGNIAVCADHAADLGPVVLDDY